MQPFKEHYSAASVLPNFNDTGFHYHGQMSPMHVNAAEGKWLGGQFFFLGDPQVCTGFMGSDCRSVHASLLESISYG